MQAQHIDASLRAAEPPPDTLADGFSPVLNMSPTTPTHPVEPEPYPLGPGGDAPANNPTQLPVEPEFGQALPPAEPEDPGVARPHP
jgi:hypothetical protein